MEIKESKNSTKKFIELINLSRNLENILLTHLFP